MPTSGKNGIIFGGSKGPGLPTGKMVINCMAEMKWRIKYGYLLSLNFTDIVFSYTFEIA